MDQETPNFKENQKLLQDELAKCKDSESSYKDYIQLMDDISAWLKETSK